LIAAVWMQSPVSIRTCWPAEDVLVPRLGDRQTLEQVQLGHAQARTAGGVLHQRLGAGEIGFPQDRQSGQGEATGDHGTVGGTRSALRERQASGAQRGQLQLGQLRRRRAQGLSRESLDGGEAFDAPADLGLGPA
jgi:hypothetical protein